ncbi:MAG: glutaminyl-peptide cyclotransferase [Caldilineaceae bacterium]|nr:glutaminyl-peptide cyclotransferase [Caldilineaceae bacterium]
MAETLVVNSPLASPPPPTTTYTITYNSAAVAADSTLTETADSLQTPIWSYEIISTYPHDPTAFTQGLIWLDNIFYEGTGLRGRSSLRQVDRDTGDVRKQIDLPAQYFGEGITILGDKLYQLTWQSHTGFIYNKDTFTKLADFPYATEGWGITHNGQQLIMSDGSSTLYIWDPDTLAELGQIQVTDQGQPVMRLNELEYIHGQIYANVWQTNYIAVIDPTSGNVTAWLDLTGILAPADRTGQEDVLNGIAYNAENDTLYITGKLWPKLFEIRTVVPQ